MNLELHRPKVSILIATRNGLKYLPFAINSVLSQTSGDFELIVSDNHSTDGTAQYLSEICDARFRHTSPPFVMSMPRHFEFVVSEAEGEWITILGDDDGLLPFFFEKLNSIGLDDITTDAIVFRRAYYFWDGCEELYKDQVVSYYPSNYIETRNNNFLIFLCVCSVIDYTHLPQLYTTGLIKRHFIEAIKSQFGGQFFHGSSPDASSSVALALNSAKHTRIEDPIFWTGTSPKSTGFSSGSSVKKERISEFNHLNSLDKHESNSALPTNITDIFDLTVIFYETLLCAPNSPALWSTAIMRNFFLAGLLLKNNSLTKQISLEYGTKYVSLILPPFKLLIKMLKWLYLRRVVKKLGYERPFLRSDDRRSFPTMIEASEAVLRLYKTEDAKLKAKQSCRN